MAKVTYIRARKYYRIRVSLGPRGRSVAYHRHFRMRPEAQGFADAITPIEHATRLGQARDDDITRWINLGFITEALAREFFNGAGVYIETATDYKKLEDLFDQFARLHPRSARATLSRSARIFAWLRTNLYDLRDLDAKIVARYLAELHGDGASQKTVYHYAVVLRQILDIAVDEHMMKHNVARDAKWRQPKRADSPRRPISDKERDKIFSTVESKKEIAGLLGGALEIACYLGLYLGLRNREAELLTWDNVDFDAELVRIRTTTLPDGTVWKPKTEGVIPMADELVERLRVWKTRQSDHDFVLGGHRTSKGVCKPWQMEAITKTFKKLTRKAKLADDVTFYCFRHRFARKCLMPKDEDGMGLDVFKVMTLMRHSDITTTQLYQTDMNPEENVLKGARF